MVPGPTTSHRSLLYPIGLKVAGKGCLVVGSGALARRKAEELLDCGALVHMVDPEAADLVATGDAVERLTVSHRAFVPADLDGVQLVVVSIGNAAVQQDVARAAAKRGIPCNVVDVNDLCTFYAPAVLRVGSVTISIATDGKFPLLAVAIRDRIAAVLGEAIGPALEILSEGRDLACARFPGQPEKRVAALRRLLSETTFNAILAGRLDEFEEHWTSWKTELTSQT